MLVLLRLNDSGRLPASVALARFKSRPKAPAMCLDQEQVCWLRSSASDPNNHDWRDGYEPKLWRVVMKQDGTVARHDYLPFGEEIPSTIGGRSSVSGYGSADSTRPKFTQKERDSESGLDYFLARYYSSAQGRFTSVDPSMTSARAVHPQSWNRYSYTINNPLRYTDPTGLDWWYDARASTAQPTWFDSDPGGKWKRWTDNYSYVYQPVNAGGLWVALNPSGPQAFLTDTQQRAQAKSDEWAGTELFSGTPAERDWVAGFGVGSSPLGTVLDWANALAGADTTSPHPRRQTFP